MFKGPRTRIADVQGQEKTDIPAQEEKRESVLPPPFCSIRALSGLSDAPILVRADLLHSVYQMKCSSLPEMPLLTHTHPGIMFY